ncbi:MAG: hypothetical protein AAB579_00025 [Patescibacteria group bacterium]|mgnify:CR=1 FL=1
MEKKLGELRQGDICIAEFDGRRRVLMRVLLTDVKGRTFDDKAGMYVQLSGHDHTKGHGIVFANLDPEMIVRSLPVTVSVDVPR